LAIVTEHGDAFSTGKADYLGAIICDLIDTANIDPVSFGCQRIAEALAEAGSKVQTGNNHQTESRQRRVDGALLQTKRSQGYVHDEQTIRRINEHVQSLPNARRQILLPEIMTGRRHEEKDYQREKPQRLERKSRQRTVLGVRAQEGDQRI